MLSDNFQNDPDDVTVGVSLGCNEVCNLHLIKPSLVAGILGL
jgi:hypothetical protein